MPGCSCRCWIFLLALPATCAQAGPPRHCPIRLVDATAESGIAFRHTDGGSGQQYIVEFMVAGLALFDYDGDGLVDVYFLNGAPLKGTVVDALPRNALYRNNGDWTFRDVTERAGVGDTGYGLGVTAGDYDNDGDQDLYLNNFGPNVLYRNNGDGTFSDVTAAAGVGCGDKFGAGACFLDFDGDADLDLYVANYLHFSYEEHAARIKVSFPYPPGPQDFRPVPDTLYRNNGDGTFTDVSGPSGVDSVAGTAMGMTCFDYEDDGDTDVFVCNDARPNFLFRNDGAGRFQEVGLAAGVAFDFAGNANGSMAVDCGDYDNDGCPDLFMTDYTGELPVLYRSVSGGFFEDATNRARAGNSAFSHTKWGTGFADLDNDGDRDLLIACGHFLTNVREIDDRTAYRVRNVLLMNTGDGKFADVSEQCGNGLKVMESSRGIGLDDLDNDGDVDLVVLNANARPTILRNESRTGNHWLKLRLRGVNSNRDGVGARVRVAAGDLVQVDEVHSGRSYQSHYGTRLHFGLKKHDRVDRVEVRWIGGGVDVFTDLAADQTVLLSEGTGKPGG